MNFQIRGLPASSFSHLLALDDTALRSHLAMRRVVDSKPGFPCRVSLQDAEVGENVLLLNFQHLTVASPFQSSHAIYVRERAMDAALEVNEVAEVLRSRLLSVRAFDVAGMMQDADVVPGMELEPVLRRMLGHRSAAFLHVHYAKLGCFAASVRRAD